MSAQSEHTTSGANSPQIEALFNVGAHYGFIKSRRHPTAKQFIFGTKNKIEIFDLEKTETQLNAALEFIRKIAGTGKQIVFVGSKSEARQAVKSAADRVALPYVASRWIGGTFTNFDVIRKRVEKLLNLTSQKEKGELTKYTKKERVMIDREIDRLNDLFSGITSMTTLPGAIFVVDPKKEHIAVAEARDKRIPVIALAGSDCDMSLLTYAIAANDASMTSIAYFLDQAANAYSEGKKAAKEEAKTEERPAAAAQHSTHQSHTSAR